MLTHPMSFWVSSGPVPSHPVVRLWNLFCPTTCHTLEEVVIVSTQDFKGAEVQKLRLSGIGGHQTIVHVWDYQA